MIDIAIEKIAIELNRALKQSHQAVEDLVVVSNVRESDGSVATHVANKMVVSLVNVERNSAPRRTVGASHLDLMVVFAAHFGGLAYTQGLEILSSTVAYFDGRPVLDHQNTANLDPRIDKLVLEIENLSLGDVASLWRMLGGVYVPSVLYRVRIVAAGH
jgi:uncharacterized protein DUF4255